MSMHSDTSLVQPRITFILPHLDSTDEDAHLRVLKRVYREVELAKVLGEKGADVEFCLPSVNLNPSCFEYRGVNVLTFDSEVIDRKTLLSYGMINYLNERQPDLLLFKGMGYALTAHIWLNLRNPPVLACIVAGGTSDLLSKCVDYAFVESDSQYDAFQNSCTQKKIIHKYVPVDESGHREEVEKRWDVVSVGRLSEFKNHHTLVPLGRKLKVALIGAGPQKGHLERLIKEDMASKFEILGHLDHHEVLKVIAQSRVMVHPSRHEGFPRAMAEAIALGVPVIADSDVIRYPINENGLGMLCKGHEILDVTKALLADESSLDQMSDKCIRYGEQHFGTGSLRQTASVLMEAATSRRHVANDPYVRVKFKSQILGRRMRSRIKHAIGKLKS